MTATSETTEALKIQQLVFKELQCFCLLCVYVCVCLLVLFCFLSDILKIFLPVSYLPSTCVTFILLCLATNFSMNGKIMHVLFLVWVFEKKNFFHGGKI